MANENEITQTLMVLAGATLRNQPTKEQVPQVVATWSKVFAKYPAPVLAQAAADYVEAESFWPTPAAFKKIVDKVDYNHGRSLSDDPSRQRAPYKGVARITAEGWTAIYPEELHPEPIEKFEYFEPPAHPEFTSWEEAQAWQEKEKTK